MELNAEEMGQRLTTTFGKSISGRWLRELANRGQVPRLPNGKFDPEATEEAFRLQQEEKMLVRGANEALAEARTKLAERQEEMTTLKIAVMRGELVEADSVTAVATHLIGGLKSALMAMPAAVAPRIVGRDAQEVRRVLEEEVRLVLVEAARLAREPLAAAQRAAEQEEEDAGQRGEGAAGGVDERADPASHDPHERVGGQVSKVESGGLGGAGPVADQQGSLPARDHGRGRGSGARNGRAHAGKPARKNTDAAQLLSVFH